jgi:glycine oxidase
MHIAIAGTGLLGRLAAVMLLARGHQVTLFEKDTQNGEASCGFVAAGMLALFTERDCLLPGFQDLARRSQALWPSILANLPAPVAIQQQGSLLLAHASDAAELERYENMIRNVSGQRYERLNAEKIQALEPALNFSHGLFFPEDGAINNRQFYDASTVYLREKAEAWHVGLVVEVSPFEVKSTRGTQCFDAVFDCRGLGAKNDWPNLRGVRGELLWLHCPEVVLTRPVRVLHPRHAIYLVPRGEGQFVLGATTIESEDDSPVSVRSALELLSLLYTMHPAFAEARIERLIAACRPAFPDHLPAMEATPGLLRLNGLYRHGYLLAPALVEQALNYLEPT